MSLEATMATRESSIETPVESTSTPTATPESAQGPQGEAKTASATEGSALDRGSQEHTNAGEEGETQEVKFTPRSKFKVMDAEHEVPAWMLKAIENADTEKEAIELLEKAHGLSFVKDNLQTTRKERDDVRQNYSKTMSDIQEVREAYQKGDLDLFLDKLAIPHERMLQWALDKVNYSQLPPDQQRVIDERRDAQRKAYLAEKQVGSYEQQMFEQAQNAKLMLLQAGLARPDVKTFADTYDAQVGKPGAFLEEVKATGNLAWHTSNGKVDLTPDQAIEQVMQKWGKVLQPKAQTGAAAPVIVPGPGAAASASPSAKSAVIPNVAGRSTSPMKSKPRSLDDLKKLGKEMTASQH